MEFFPNSKRVSPKLYARKQNRAKTVRKEGQGKNGVVFTSEMTREGSETLV